MRELTALAAARHAVLQRVGWNVEADGLFGAPPITVITGEEAHPSLTKALGMLGLGRNRLVRAPVDGQGRMRAVISALQKEGTCWCGPTVWQGRTAMRISVSSWATTDADVEASLAAMLRVAG